MLSRKTTALWLAGIFYTVFVLTSQPLVAQDRNLLTRSTPLASVQGANYSGLGWHWLSQKELLTERKVTDHQTELIRINIATHTVRSLPKAARLFQTLSHPVPDAILTNREARVSPDGRWLLLYNFFDGWSGSGLPDDESPIRRTAVAMSLDGKHQVTFRMAEAGACVAWLPDSRHWIALGRQADKIITYSLRHPEQTTSTPLVLPSRQDAFPAGGFAIAGVTPQSVVILSAVADALVGRRTWLVYYTVDLKATPLRVHSFTFEQPDGVQMFYAVPSPDGRRIAWLWWVEDKEAYGSYLHRQGIVGPTFTEGGEQLWVSTLQGTRWQALPLPRDMSNLFWEREGKRLFYTSETDLWSLPVP